MKHIGHLARRFFGSLSRREPPAPAVAWALAQLLSGEAALWQQMSVQDRRHSIAVARRFAALVTDPTRAEMAGALLHDVGKTQSGLGTLGRVITTTIGPRTKRFRSYHDHETIGRELLREAGAQTATLELIDGAGPNSPALRAADAI